MLSSAWETEQKQNEMVDWADPKNNWMRKDIREHITRFQDTQIEAEFADAVENHRVEEVYWVGGEPLMYEQHWRYMQRIIELGDGGRVYARYNTNLSRVDFRNNNLYRDILDNIRAWQICASIDGTGQIGEYIRTGLEFSTFLNNFEQGVRHARHPRQMRLDFTLTLPGMFEVGSIQKLAQQFQVELLAKVVFSFSPDIVMSPLCLPRVLLDPWLDELINQSTADSMRNVLIHLKSRPTFEEQWPDTYKSALIKGKQRILKLEQIRTQSITMTDILAQRSHQVSICIHHFSTSDLCDRYSGTKI
jgi:hypothetical protein